MQISTSIKQCYFSANSCIMLSSLPILKSIYKVDLAIFKSSFRSVKSLDAGDRMVINMVDFQGHSFVY